ncbi:2-amino-3-ketobutyrate coenzyme A ligase [Nymphon striatum]|nr:2-amino-3-ketobutyrate coenzyme A ligase [Nymphon striatum]
MIRQKFRLRCGRRPKLRYRLTCLSPHLFSDMTHSFLSRMTETLDQIQADGLMKQERMITSPQAGQITVGDRQVINLCANNYLGLADHPDLIASAKQAMDDHGYGMASVRFICGTQDIHKQLEQRLAAFLGMDDAILFAACFDANAAVFEPLLGVRDAIVSDSLNHASIIDGIRPVQSKTLRDARANGARDIMIATDGVFSMDGYLADLRGIRQLADKYDALVMVDDCHATGFMGPKGAGTPAHSGVDVDILTGTLGKALGGAIGGYIAGPQAVIDLLRQRARPYLFSNSLPPAVVAAGLTALDLVEKGDDLRKQLFENTAYWRDGLSKLGFDLLPGEHPIVPIMLGDAQKAQTMACSKLFEEGIYVSGFFYPVVPLGQARIRTQMNAALTRAELDSALTAFERVGKAVGVI